MFQLKHMKIPPKFSYCQILGRNNNNIVRSILKYFRFVHSPLKQAASAFLGYSGSDQKCHLPPPPDLHPCYIRTAGHRVSLQNHADVKSSWRGKIFAGGDTPQTIQDGDQQASNWHRGGCAGQSLRGLLHLLRPQTESRPGVQKESARPWVPVHCPVSRPCVVFTNWSSNLPCLCRSPKGQETRFRTQRDAQHDWQERCPNVMSSEYSPGRTSY